MNLKITGILTLVLLLISAGLASSNSPQNQNPKILFVCSDLEDVSLANSFGDNVDILYLGRDLPDDRSRLSDILYLAKYDEIWIPDLNAQWTEGGRLNGGEIKALREYVRIGGVLVLGLNTYTQSWSRELDRLFGVRLLRVEKPKNDTPEWDVVFNGRVYPYNDTYQTVVVRPVSARVLARYKNGNPAITLNHYGFGVAVLMTFNPVKGYVEGDPSLIEVYRAVSAEALNERKSSPHVSGAEKALILLKRALFHPVTLGLLAFLTLEVLAYLGFMPMGLTVLFAAPLLPLWKWFKIGKRCARIMETVGIMRGATLSELAKELGEKVRSLKFCLALLQLRRKITLLDVSKLGEKEYLVALRGLEAEGVAAWAVKRYPRLMKMIALHPGITILDLARSSNMPPYEVLRLLRELSRYGVVEIREMPFDYEVYPTRALSRWFEE